MPFELRQASLVAMIDYHDNHTWQDGEHYFSYQSIEIKIGEWARKFGEQTLVERSPQGRGKDMETLAQHKDMDNVLALSCIVGKVQPSPWSNKMGQWFARPLKLQKWEQIKYWIGNCSS